jgi:hypothetical protein
MFFMLDVMVDLLQGKRLRRVAQPLFTRQS